MEWKYENLGKQAIEGKHGNPPPSENFPPKSRKEIFNYPKLFCSFLVVRFKSSDIMLLCERPLAFDILNGLERVGGLAVRADKCVP